MTLTEEELELVKAAGPLEDDTDTDGKPEEDEEDSGKIAAGSGVAVGT